MSVSCFLFQSTQSAVQIAIRLVWFRFPFKVIKRIKQYHECMYEANKFTPDGLACPLVSRNITVNFRGSFDPKICSS